MREIIFRGKRIDNGEWVEGYYYKTREGNTRIHSPHTVFKQHFTVLPETVGQYTGLGDKNGKKIFEGDIVRYTFDNPDSSFATENGLRVWTEKVFWQEWRGSFAVGRRGTNNDLFHYVRNGNRVEIIGNIHDNPELLKQ